MVVENVTGILPEEIVSQLVTLTRLFQALGGLIIAYIIFGIVNTILNRKKQNEMKRMRILLEEMNKKLGKLKNK